MQQRILGHTGQQLATPGLGCMGMSEFYGPGSEEESLATLEAALEMGVTFWDTADMYGYGANERLLARALAGGRRQQVFLATKFGIVRGNDPVERQVNGHPDYVRSACEASLKRLGVEVIDLYYQHRIDPGVPLAETVGAMADLVTAGKVRFLGLSEASPQQLREAVAVHPVAALQTEYSLWTRDVEAEILPACRELGIGFVAYSPLGRGMLTGAISDPATLASDDWRRSNPRFQGENFRENRQRLQALTMVAGELAATPAQVALAWLLSRGPDIIPIPGTRRLSRLQENCAAADLQLTPDQLERLDEAFPPGSTRGARYA